MKNKKLLKYIIWGTAGAAGGFAYYYFVGCSGGCPITGNPFISTAYGGVLGLTLSNIFSPAKK